MSHSIKEFEQVSTSRSINQQQPRGTALDRFRSYNQYPFFYKSLSEMTGDLKRIKDMGFSSVWVNPLFEPCKSVDWISEEIRKVEAEKGITKTKIHSKAGSPYAIKSFSINEKISNYSSAGLTEPDRQKADYKDIRAYTDKCRELGLMPMTDIVMRHVSADSDLVKTHPQWFKRHPNGNFVIFGRDENYKAQGQSWDDVLEFNYDDPIIMEEILEDHIRPMCKMLISEFGFEGLRVDAAGKIPKQVYDRVIPYVDMLCLRTHGKKAKILGETLGQDISEFLHASGYVDYVYNSLYFYPYNQRFWEKDDTPVAHCKGVLQSQVAPTVGFAGNHDVSRIAGYYGENKHIRGQFLKATIEGNVDNQTVFNNVLAMFRSQTDKGSFSPETMAEYSFMCDAIWSKHDKSETDKKPKNAREWFALAGVVTEEGKKLYNCICNMLFKIVKREKYQGHSGYTDIENQGSQRIDEMAVNRLLPSNFNPNDTILRIKEGFCVTAFASDGGWFFFKGDEWGAIKSTNVFNSSPADLQQKIPGGIDFSPLITDINKTLAQLPPPSNPEWAQRCFLNNEDSVDGTSCFYIHQGKGFSGTGHLVFCNIADNLISTTVEQFLEYTKAGGRNIGEHKKYMPDCVYFCGDIKPDLTLSLFLEKQGIKISHSRDTQADMPMNQSDLSHPVSIPL